MCRSPDDSHFLLLVCPGDHICEDAGQTGHKLFVGACHSSGTACRHLAFSCGSSRIIIVVLALLITRFSACVQLNTYTGSWFRESSPTPAWSCPTGLVVRCTGNLYKQTRPVPHPGTLRLRIAFRSQSAGKRNLQARARLLGILRRVDVRELRSHGRRRRNDAGSAPELRVAKSPADPIPSPSRT